MGERQVSNLNGCSWWNVWWSRGVGYRGVEHHSPLLGGVAVKLLVKDHLLPGEVREVEPAVLTSILLPEYVLQNLVLALHLGQGDIIQAFVLRKYGIRDKSFIL